MQDAGTYALLLRCPRPQRLRVGKLGLLRVREGHYVYVGSAFGPGGISARTRRYCAIAASPHWHIDYLRPRVRLVEIWCTNDPARREHLWASHFRAMDDAVIPLQGFGASDCGCASHLFFFPQRPRIARFRGRMHDAIPDHAAIERRV